MASHYHESRQAFTSTVSRGINRYFLQELEVLRTSQPHQVVVGGAHNQHLPCAKLPCWTSTKRRRVHCKVGTSCLEDSICIQFNASRAAVCIKLGVGKLPAARVDVLPGTKVASELLAYQRDLVASSVGARNILAAANSLSCLRAA